jgi:hypothetical protein
MMISARDRSRGGPVHGPAQAPGGGSRRNFISFERSDFPRGLNPPLEAGAIGAPLERGKFSQTARDIIAVFGIAVFIILTAASYVVSFYVVFFVGLG